MPKLILFLLLITATISVNAQLIPKDTTVTHDSTIFLLTKNVKPIPYDSAYKTPIRDTSVLVPIMTVDSSKKVIDKITCTTRKRWWSKHVFVNCDTTWKKVYDTTTTLVLQPTKTLPRDTSSKICCKDSIWYSVTPKDSSVTHDSVVYRLSDKIKWGLKISQDNFNNQLNVANQIGLISIRPSSLGVRDFNGDIGNVIKWKQAGLFTVMNVNWIDNPTEKPYNFVSGIDTVKFKTNFERICVASIGYADVIVIENEPTNLQYYNWSSNTDASNYIHELQMAIPIAHKYGLKIADGWI